jgi:hypothetical protein
MNSAVPRIMIRDDGELDEVRAVLDDLGLDWADGAKDDPGALPSHMLISSGACAIDSLRALRSQGAQQRLLHLVIVDRASRSLRNMLERAGCDMVARRPVHQTVIRLLTQRALFAGDERRQLERVAIGIPIKIKTGMIARTAVLAELSQRGCGLIMRSATEVGTDVRLALPSKSTDVKALPLVGRVVGTQPNLTLEAGQHAAAVVFKSLTRSESKRVVAFMQSYSVGHTGRLARPLGFQQSTRNARLQDADPAPESAPETQVSPAATGAERRSTPRGTFSESILARTSKTTHSLLGCDLSVGGMRVAPDASLGMGARLQLAIFGEGGVRPVTVIATIVRDDGEHGLGLKFSPLDSTEKARLQRIVDALDELSDAPSGTATVVSEVLGRD